MLRIRPTSIGLSDRDIDIHFDQIELYRTLRKEGYTKYQIQQFYDTQQQIKREQENDPEEENPSPQSTPEATKVAVDVPVLQSSPPQPRRPVRHTSLLRFSQNASTTSASPEDASATELDPVRLSESPRSHVMTYRPRSQTYPWLESEADEEGAPGNDQYQYPVDDLAALTIARPQTPYLPPKSKDGTPLRAEAQEFTPFTLPSPVGLTISRAPPQTEHQLRISQVAPPLTTREPPITPPRRSSLAHHLLLSSGNSSTSPSVPMSLPAASPATASHVPFRNPRHTEPRTYEAHGRGSRLSIYDDRLSPHHQPQTPADMARRPLLTDRDTAYTAPPGSIGGPRLRTADNDTSPTTRSRDLRTRWTREFQRGEAVERERANQPRERMQWLDEWAADRVGEENS